MYTVYDYLDYYNDITFEKEDFNDMDNIILSSLAYLTLDNVKEEKSLINVFNEYKKNNTKEDTLIGSKASKILNIIVKGKRFESLTFANYKCIVDDKTQFSAITFRTNDFCYVAFRGTDNSIIGWKENLKLSFIFPVNAQTLAINYLKETINDKDKIVYVGGHSKGGNLAMASVLKCPDNIYNKIKTVYNNDGPGFLKKEFNSKEFQRLSRKLKNFLPEESVVGILLENKNYQVIKSKEKNIHQHDLTSWLCFGPFLVKGNLDSNNQKLKNKMNLWLEQIDDGNKQILIENFFKVIEESGVKHMRELKSLKLNDLSAMITEAKNIDENSKALLIDTLKSFAITYSRKKES